MKRTSLREIFQDVNKRSIVVLLIAFFLYIVIAITEYFVFLRTNLISIDFGSMAGFIQAASIFLAIIPFFISVRNKSKNSRVDGHVETLVKLLISFFVILLGVFYFVSSIDRYPFPSAVSFSWKYLFILIAMVLAKIGIGLGLGFANRKERNQVLTVLEYLSYFYAVITMLNILSYSVANTLRIGVDAIVTTLEGVFLIVYGIFVFQKAVRSIIRTPSEKADSENVENLNPPTKEEKRKRTKKQVLTSVIAVIIILSVFATVAGFTGMIGYSVNRKIVLDRLPVEYENQLVPTLGEDGAYTFVTDDEFRVMQITDVHIGAGVMTIQKDKWALNAVATMVTVEKPDLVILTGDIAYPFGFQTGSFNNLKQIKIVAELMEELGVYWTIIFGNHDSESPCTHSRQEISDYLVESELTYCLFQEGPDNIDGKGNHYITVKNTQGLITNAFVMLDSHAYRKDRSYDNVKQNQVDWYEGVINSFKESNAQILDTLDKSTLIYDEDIYRNPNSLLFIHIPLREYEVAWERYSTEGNSEDVEYIYGVMRAPMNPVNCGSGEDELFETALELGSTTGVFVGHDHLNNFQIAYKGIRLTYALSIDYTAFVGIDKQGAQRGCTLISCQPDGTWESENSHYYQIKYDSPDRTENVHFN